MAFHRKHESLDMPVEVGTRVPLDCSTIEHVRLPPPHARLLVVFVVVLCELPCLFCVCLS